MTGESTTAAGNSIFASRPRRRASSSIPPPEITVDGKTLRGEKLRLVVQPPSAQDLAAVELTADRREVYPTQPFTVTLSVFVKELPAPCRTAIPSRCRSRGPCCGSPGSPTRTCRPDWRPRKTGRWVKKFIDRDGVGFGLTISCSKAPFRSLARTSAIAFRPKPQTAIRRDAKGQEAKYRRYDFKRTFTAKAAGPISLAAVTLQGPFVNGVADDGQLPASRSLRPPSR